MSAAEQREQPGEVVLVTAADDAYAAPLAVMVRSALDALGPGRRLSVWVLDGGLTDSSKERLLRSWTDPRIVVHWRAADLNAVHGLVTSDHVNVVTYLRLLAPRLLPESVHRAIYLDADTLVRRDLGDLWDTPQQGRPVLAAADLAAPVFDATLHLSSFERCKKRLAAWTPVMNYRDLGLPGDAKYFNGGVLVADLDQWRRESLGEQMLRVLIEQERHVLWWDQYALNVVLCQRWGELDSRWNQGAHLFEYPRWSESPLPRREYLRLRSDPWIVHFCSPSKPWHFYCAHPRTAEFRRTLLRTAWRDWRPEPPAQRWRAWKKAHYDPVRRRVEAEVRAWRQAARGPGRAA